jgi:hypothetical protein
LRNGLHVRARPLWVRIITNTVILIAMLAAAVVLFAALMLGFVVISLKLVT